MAPVTVDCLNTQAIASWAMGFIVIPGDFGEHGSQLFDPGKARLLSVGATPAKIMGIKLIQIESAS